MKKRLIIGIGIFLILVSIVSVQTEGEFEDSEKICVPLFMNGDPKEKVDVVILGDLYTKDELELFSKDSEAFMNSILSFEPFKSYKDVFNFYRIDKVNEFGCLCDRVITGVSRVGCCDSIKIMNTASVCNPDQIIVSINTDINIGGGASGLTWVRRKAPILNTIVHEFGHSFGWLYDEYYSSFTMEDVKFKDIRNYGQALNCDVQGCPNWCSSTFSLGELSKVDCAYSIIDLCFKAKERGEPCDYLFDERGSFSCKNTVAFCSQFKNKDECNVKREYLSCSWREDLQIFGSSCIPEGINSINLGKGCVEEAGCYLGCGYANLYRSSLTGGVMGSAGVTGEATSYSPIAYDILKKKLEQFRSFSSMNLVGDFNKDCIVDFSDFLLFVKHFDEDVNEENRIFNLNDVGVSKNIIDVFDFLDFADNYYGRKCEVEKPEAIKPVGLAKPAGLVGDFNGDGCVDGGDFSLANKGIRDWIQEMKNAPELEYKLDCGKKQEVADLVCRNMGKGVPARGYEIGRTNKVILYLPSKREVPPGEERDYFSLITCADGIDIKEPAYSLAEYIMRRVNPCYESFEPRFGTIQWVANMEGESAYLNIRNRRYYDDKDKERFDAMFGKYDLDFAGDVTWDENDQKIFKEHLGEGSCDLCSGYLGEEERNKCYIIVAAKPSVLDESVCDKIRDSGNKQNEENLKSICRQKIQIGKGGKG